MIVGVGVVVTYVAVKWTVAIILAPETGGLSLLLFATP
jgi:hypothetical protein